MATSGEPLSDVEKISLYRHVEHLPLGIATSPTRGELEREEPRAGRVALFERVPVIPPRQFERLAARIGEIAREEMPAYTTGARIVAVDRPELAAEGDGPIRYTYGVTTTSGGVESDLSNLVTIVPVDVSVAPVAVNIRITPEGAVLDWEAPQTTISGDEIEGEEHYFVYRYPESGSVLPEDPVNETPVSSSRLVDQAPYGRYRYGVTRVSNVDPIQESEISLLQVIDVTDMTPPPPPTGVNPLVQANQIRVVWEESDSTDVAGYRIYRGTLDSDPVLMEELQGRTETSWTDPGAETGVEYVYLVTTVDAAGNESERVRTEPVLLRR